MAVQPAERRPLKSQSGNCESVPERRRVILLGASNLTLAFPMLVESLRAILGPVALYAAHGHGRSYGLTSRVLIRTLPGIHGCAMWTDLAAMPPTTARPIAVVTDIGNDLLYGASVPQIVGWVEACLQRLSEHRAAIVLTRLPLDSVLKLGPARYSATKACFFPGKGPGWERMRSLAGELDQAVAELGQKYAATCVRPRAAWYGIDPIHVRRRLRPAAWSEFLAPLLPSSTPPQVVQSGLLTSLNYWRLRPASRRVWWRTQTEVQPVWTGSDSSTVSLY
jgi:hypothetical protein